MGGEVGDAPDVSEKGSRWTRLRLTAAVIGLVVVLIAGATVWRHLAVGDGEVLAEDSAPSWIAGYVASPQDTELIIVLEACEDWGLDEVWLMPSDTDTDRVKVYIGWWNMSLPQCDEPELRTIAFQLSDPLGNRGVFDVTGGEILPFEGVLPPESD